MVKMSVLVVIASLPLALTACAANDLAPAAARPPTAGPQARLIQAMDDRNIEIRIVGPASSPAALHAAAVLQGEFNFLNGGKPSLAEEVTFTNTVERDAQGHLVHRDRPAIMVVLQHQPAPVSGPMRPTVQNRISTVDSTFVAFVDPKTSTVLDALSWSDG